LEVKGPSPPAAGRRRVEGEGGKGGEQGRDGEGEQGEEQRGGGLQGGKPRGGSRPELAGGTRDGGRARGADGATGQGHIVARYDRSAGVQAGLTKDPAIIPSVPHPTRALTTAPDWTTSGDGSTLTVIVAVTDTRLQGRAVAVRQW
jgi:hypothetical protein